MEEKQQKSNKIQSTIVLPTETIMYNEIWSINFIINFLLEFLVPE